MSLLNLIFQTLSSTLTYFNPPSEENQLDNLYNHLSRNLLLICIIVVTPLCVIFFLRSEYIAFATAIIPFVISVVGLILTRYGKQRVAMTSLIVCAIFGNYTGAFSGEGVYDFGFQSMYMMMVLVTIFYGKHWLAVLTTSNISFTLFLYAMEAIDVIEFWQEGRSPVADTIIAISLICLLYLILRFTVQQLVISNRQMAIARNEAENANRSKSMFLANMSHELRTPLNAIIGYSEMLYELFDENEEIEIAKEGLADSERINIAANHLLQLITDILDLTKIEADRVELKPAWFDIDFFLDELEGTIRPVIEQNQNRFIINNEMSIKILYGDRVRLLQILINLLSNAARFTEQGEVELGVAEKDDVVEFYVRDTGIGISPELHEQIFQPFQQGNSALNRKYQGTGLGLTISKTLVGYMGGEMQLESAPGKGSVFRLEIPLFSEFETVGTI
ncbi:MAG: ATP-binding protein [Chloroflexota bacterium]